MKHRVFVRQPGLFTIRGGKGEIYRGADQDWYPTAVQRWKGCGPTAAAVILSYLAARPGLEALYPGRPMDQDSFVQLMCQVWDYVTPREHGLHQPSMFQEGVRAFGDSRGVPLDPKVLEIPAARTHRPSFGEVSAFLRSSLERDCPVAFLNLSNGKVSDLDRWHWVTIIGIDGPMVHILDSGREFPIDLALWHETTKKRGGFVAVLPAASEGGEPTACVTDGGESDEKSGAGTLEAGCGVGDPAQPDRVCTHGGG